MTIEQNQQPYRLNCTVLEALSALVRSGARMQIGVRTGDVLHERQGAITTVSQTGSLVHIHSEEHDSWIDTSAVRAMVVQENQAAMSARALPRLSLLGEDGGQLMVLVCLDGVDAFRAALSHYAGEGCEPVPSWPRPLTPFGEDDAGLQGLKEFEGDIIALTMKLPFSQSRWIGQLTEVRTGESFINIIRPSVHLHLRGGVVARWEKRENASIAFGQDGTELGLSVERLVQ